MCARVRVGRFLFVLGAGCRRKCRLMYVGSQILIRFDGGLAPRFVTEY